MRPPNGMSGISISSITKALTELGKNYWLTRLVLQRSLALVYLIAFIAVVHQFKPLHFISECYANAIPPQGQGIGCRNAGFLGLTTHLLFQPKDSLGLIWQL